jgi:mono/diheme cytochrome c family protein
MKTKSLAVCIGVFIAWAVNPAATMAEPGGASTNGWTAPARAARKNNPIPANTASIAKGKELYLDACSTCHGATGKGDGRSAGTLERRGVQIRPGDFSDSKQWQQTDGELFWKISEGRRPMPSWDAKLTEEERWSIVNFVRTLAPKPQTNNVSNKPGANS